MDVTLARRLFDEQLRRGTQPSPTTRVDRTEQVVREVSLGIDGWAAVVWSDLDEGVADAAIAAQLAYFAEVGRQFEWKLYDGDQPADLPDRLQEKGFTPDESEALMIADIDDLDLSTQPPDGVRIEEVRDATGLEGCRRAGAEAFGQSAASMDGFLRDLLHRLGAAPDRLTVVLASAGDRPLCAARTEFHPGTQFASLWGGGTVPDWRGRGVYRSVVAHRARQARNRGYQYLRVDALPASEPILTRLGFVRAGTTTPYQSPAAVEPAQR
jgi:GNAT superfamily N-acetyltransferase